MDTNNWRPVQAEQNMDVSDDWRTQLQPDSRERIVNKIMETLKRHLPFSGQDGLHELKKIAIRFEEKICSAASSQVDYLRKISLKMLTMDASSQNPMTSFVPSTSGGNDKNPADSASQVIQMQLPNQENSFAIPSAQTSTVQNFAASSVDQAVPSNIFADQQKQFQGSGAYPHQMGQGVPSGIFANQQIQFQGLKTHPQQIIPNQQQQKQLPQHQYLYQQLLSKSYQQESIPQLFMQESPLVAPYQIQPSQEHGFNVEQINSQLFSLSIGNSSCHSCKSPCCSHNSFS